MNSNNPLVKIKHNFVLDRKILFIENGCQDSRNVLNKIKLIFQPSFTFNLLILLI